jgi:flavin-dependent dehydrogenase
MRTTRSIAADIRRRETLERAPKETDIFVIGGGPAGLASAIAARQRGFEVTVADGAQPPIEKPCGEGLMPGGRAALEKLGILVPTNESHPIRGIRFVSGDLSVESSFSNGRGVGVRRSVLHRIMVERAEAAGVSLLWRTPVTGLHSDGVWLSEERVRARWVIGADGGHSLLRQWAGLDRYRAHRMRFAFRRHYRIIPWSDCVELHWGPNCQMYVTPVAQDEICLALISDDPHLRLDIALPLFSELSSRLRGAEATSLERGAVSATRKLRRVYRDRVVLVGDASGTVDATTGEGLCLSFRQAEVLADCFVTGNLERYEREHRQLAKGPTLMARLMLTLDWKSAFRQRVMRAFRSDPRLFDRLLAVHEGEVPVTDLAANGLSLGWRMLCGLSLLSLSKRPVVGNTGAVN